MDYNSALNFIIDIANESKYISGEENTKRNLIEPILTTLMGYKIPEDITLEYTADIGIKFDEKVDYAINFNGINKILIEAKDIQEDSDKEYISQLYRYFAASEAEIGILTNGVKWLFFTDSKKSNIMDTIPFKEIQLTDFSEENYEFLTMFFKENYSHKTYENIIQSQNLEKNIAPGQIVSKIKEYLDSESYIEHIKQKCNLSDLSTEEIKGYLKDISTGAYLLKYNRENHNEVSLVNLSQEIIRSKTIKKIHFISQAGVQTSSKDLAITHWEELPAVCARYCYLTENSSIYENTMESICKKKKWVKKTPLEDMSIGYESVYGYDICTSISTKEAFQRCIYILKAFKKRPELVICVLNE